jgi:hypothetical protein
MTKKINKKEIERKLKIGAFAIAIELIGIELIKALELNKKNGKKNL